MILYVISISIYKYLTQLIFRVWISAMRPLIYSNVWGTNTWGKLNTFHWNFISEFKSSVSDNGGIAWSNTFLVVTHTHTHTVNKILLKNTCQPKKWQNSREVGKWLGRTLKRTENYHQWLCGPEPYHSSW